MATNKDLVHVRTEVPMLGVEWRGEVWLERTEQVQALIANGRLTVLDEDGDPKDALQGAELEKALRAAGLPVGGTVKEKQARLAEYQASPGVPVPAGGEPAGD
jgi:hypothetical protein